MRFLVGVIYSPSLGVEIPQVLGVCSQGNHAGESFILIPGNSDAEGFVEYTFAFLPEQFMLGRLLMQVASLPGEKLPLRSPAFQGRHRLLQRDGRDFTRSWGGRVEGMNVFGNDALNSR